MAGKSQKGIVKRSLKVKMDDLLLGLQHEAAVTSVRVLAGKHPYEPQEKPLTDSEMVRWGGYVAGLTQAAGYLSQILQEEDSL